MYHAITPYNTPYNTHNNTPISTPNSSNSSIESIISYNAYLSNNIPITITNTNTNTNTNINININSTLLLYTCKYCSNSINKNMNIYRGYNHSFCSNYCRCNYSQKIALLDYYLNNYDLWL